MTKRKPLTDAEKAAREAAKSAKFRELAKKRVQRALKQIELVGNLSGSGYVSTIEQITKIRETLTKAVDSALARFDKQARKAETFDL